MYALQNASTRNNLFSFENHTERENKVFCFSFIIKTLIVLKTKYMYNPSKLYNLIIASTIHCLSSLGRSFEKLVYVCLLYPTH